MSKEEELKIRMASLEKLSDERHNAILLNFKEIKEMMQENRELREADNEATKKSINALIDSIASVTSMAKSHEVELNGNQGLVAIVKGKDGEGGLIGFRSKINTSITNATYIISAILVLSGFGATWYLKSREQEILNSAKEIAVEQSKNTIMNTKG